MLEIPTPLGGDELNISDDTLRSAFAKVEASMIQGSDTRAAADLPDLYPKCTSLMQISSDWSTTGGWGLGSGAVLTMRRASGDVAWQLFNGGSLAAGPVAYMRIGSANGWSQWFPVIAPALPKAEASGTVLATTTSTAQHQNVAVTFPVGRFTLPPTVIVSVHQTTPTSSFWVMSENVTAEGFTAHCFRDTAGNIRANWLAIGGVS